MMKKLYDEIITLVKNEYGRAAQCYGATNHSSHESYAVLKEEMEEARAECISTELHVDKYWTAVKGDDYEKQRGHLREVYIHSLLAACEFVQTAAMAHKALATMENTGTKTQQGEF